MITPRILLILSALLPALSWAAPPKRLLTAADLAPISLGRHDGEVRDLIARQRYADAAQKITAKGPGPRAVKGWLLLEARAWPQAAAALEGVPKALPVLADQIRVWQAEAYSAMGDHERALAAAQGVGAGGPFRWMARRFAAKSLRLLGRLDESHKVYDALIAGGAGGDEAVGLLGKALVYIDQGKPKQAMPLLRRLDVRHPTHWAAREGQGVAKGLMETSGELSSVWYDRPIEDQLDQGEALLKVHRNDEVVALLGDLDARDLPDEQACKAQYTLGRALKKQRKFEEALTQLNGAVARCAAAKSDLLPWSRYRVALLEERMAKEDEAGAHFAELMEAHASHRLGDDGGFYLVKHLLDDKKDGAEARKLARKLVAKFPKGDMVSEALFFTVMDAIKDKQYDEALSLLSLQERLPPEPTHKRGVAGRAAYWRARLHQLKGSSKRARKGYEAVIEAHPLSWYGALAYSRLRDMDKAGARRVMKRALKAGPKRAPGGLALRKDGGVEIPQGVDLAVAHRAVMLARLGLAELAWDALKGSARGDAGLWFSAQVLHGAGAWRISHNIMRRQLKDWQRSAPAGAARALWEMGYPKAYDGLVQKVAKAAGIDPFFVWGIMREESGFNPAVQSFANAYGLMQLILPTAKSMAKKGEGPVTPEALRDPELNMKLGTRYLAHIAERVAGRLPLLPSGYNAGPGALRRWLKARGSMPLDLWVELISFEETRWYTRSVVGSWVTYSALYGERGADPIPVISMKLPKYGK